jgi:phosphoglycerate dehydrogenase-like enzyme
MARQRLVAVSYPVDQDFTGVNSEILGGDAGVVCTYELDDAGRTRVLRNADALLAWNLDEEIPAGALGQAARLGFVQMISAGVDGVDFSAVPDRLTVASNAGAYAAAMSEHVLAMTLSLAKHLPQRHAALAVGRYDKWLPSLVLNGSVCGILGFGGVGTATARLMTAFGARVHAVNRTGRTSEPVEFVGTLADLDRVLAAADARAPWQAGAFPDEAVGHLGERGPGRDHRPARAVRAPVRAPAVQRGDRHLVE